MYRAMCAKFLFYCLIRRRRIKWLLYHRRPPMWIFLSRGVNSSKKARVIYVCFKNFTYNKYIYIIHTINLYIHRQANGICRTRDPVFRKFTAPLNYHTASVYSETLKLYIHPSTTRSPYTAGISRKSRDTPTHARNVITGKRFSRVTRTDPQHTYFIHSHARLCTPTHIHTHT